MRRSLAWNGGPGPGGIFEANAREVRLGTAVPYSKYHQHGTSRMPRRQVMFAASSSTYGRLMHRWALEHAKRDLGSR